MEVVKVDRIPSAAKPVEGTDYSVVEGNPSAGDFIRVRDNGREMFSVQPGTSLPSQPVTMTKAEFESYVATLGESPSAQDAIDNWPTV